MMKISAVLHCAADMFLSDQPWGPSSFAADADKFLYSCDAVYYTVDYLYSNATLVEKNKLQNRIDDGMEKLGLDINEFNNFNEFLPRIERQSVRYAWLKFCALLAEEQGE